ncbi:hypothetical protein TW80_12040 [Loktanella sp. S4079]|nr:hypothetical protein TW80_12040 [Loktanella sp. S4079]
MKHVLQRSVETTPAFCEFADHLISQLQRMAGLAGRTAASGRHGQRRLWAVMRFESGAGRT